MTAVAEAAGPALGAGMRRKICFGIMMVALLSAVVVIFSARARMGINTDGTAYYGTAKHVMAGKGPRWPYGSREADLTWTVHFPPLFPLVVGHLSLLLGVSDPQVTVTYLHGILLAATILLTAWMVWRYTGSGWWALGSAVFLLSTADVLDAYASFMSEPLFIFLTIAGLVAVDTGARRRRGWMGALALVFLGGSLIGASYWCRYAGLSFVATAGAGLLLYPWLSWRRRIILAAVAAVPMLAGVWSNSEYVYMVLHAGMSRAVRFQPDQLVYLGGLVWIPLQWIVPVMGKMVVIGASGVVCGAVMVVRGLRRGDSRAREIGQSFAQQPGAHDAPEMPMLFVAGAIIYAALIVFSAICIDPPATPLEPRLLVPWLPMLVVVAAWALRRRIALSWRPELARAGLVVMLLALGIGNSPRFLERLQGAEQHRVGYTATRWQNSQTAQWVSDHVPPGGLIYCNCCDGLYYLADRNSVWIPKSHEGKRVRPQLAAEVKKMCEDMARNDGFLVCFNDTWAEAFGFATPKELMAAATNGAFVAQAVTDDGTIYRWKPAGSETRP